MKYTILVGILNNQYEMIFGSYDYEEVIFEKEATEDYKGLKIITLPFDDQGTIDQKIKDLNSNS